MEIRIRQAQLTDAKAIALIHVNSWKTAFSGLMPDAYIRGYTEETRTDEWRHILESQKENVFVAEANNQVVGFLSYSQSKTDKHTFGLSKLYLCPSIYGKRVGSLLMETLEDVAKASNIQNITLYVLDKNDAAISFYTKHGFTFGSDFLSGEFNGETIIDVLMEKQL
ncbi:GNAT family N-acetyltransferase [Enterovibrio sp. ZSDZ42]|uniref:GNAT family N-acetyltransferase n=1 Tax=Enterovibrio gelatinilyticus TaxID=2899819 RepID=A0ABT5R2P3_9GAMM|nr:GNAT family N-acetyltransferase [Enterovibrio sp. ZSDZ42]MDD1794542.1 GNAT family N-acetyltransferase [Enterovibrio sp. ZSDZ42]